MDKRIPVLMLAALIGLSGCGSTEVDDDRKLADASEVQEIKNFSAFEETELPTPTPTQAPEPTKEPEKPFEGNYTFDENSLLQAAFSGQKYAKSVMQDYENHIRTETLTAEGVTVILESDLNSGTSYGKVTVETASKDNLQKILLAFENGLNEKNISGFFESKYNGTDKAPLIGLADATYSEDVGKFRAVLTRVSRKGDQVPYWEDLKTNVNELIGGKCTKTLDTNGAAFTGVFAGVDFGNVAQGNVSMKKQGYTQDAEGNMKKQIQYSASYTSDNGGSYTVDVSMLGQEDDHFKILISRPDLTEDISLLSVAEHIYQAFYNGSFNTEQTLPYQADHVAVQRTDNGLEIVLK